MASWWKSSNGKAWKKSRGAPAIAEIGQHWKAMGEVMDFVPLAQLAEAQQAFAHFTPL